MCAKNRKDGNSLENTERVTIGQKIRQLRESNNLSQSELADELGLTVQQVHKYEAGLDRVSVATLFRIAAFFQVEMAWFFTTRSHGIVPMEDASKDSYAIIRAYSRIKDPLSRKALLELAKSLAKKE